MTDLNDCELQGEIKALIKQRDKGRLSQEEFKDEVSALGVDPRSVFDQRGSQIEKQINVAGNYIDQRQMLPAGASPDALRRAYLHQLAQHAGRLPLSGDRLRRRRLIGERDRQWGRSGHRRGAEVCNRYG